MAEESWSWPRTCQHHHLVQITSYPASVDNIAMSRHMLPGGVRLFSPRLRGVDTNRSIGPEVSSTLTVRTWRHVSFGGGPKRLTRKRSLNSNCSNNHRNLRERRSLPTIMTTAEARHHESVADGHAESVELSSNNNLSQNGVSDSSKKLESPPIAHNISQEAPGVHEHVRLKLLHEGTLKANLRWC